MCWRKLFITDQRLNKPQAKERRQERALFCLHGLCEQSFLLTQLLEIIFYAAPGVFGDEGFDQAPWLLLVFHVGKYPGSTTKLLDGTIANIKSQTDTIIIPYFRRHFRFELRVMQYRF